MPCITLTKYNGTFTTLDKNTLLINQLIATDLHDAVAFACRLAEEDTGNLHTYKDLVELTTTVGTYCMSVKCAMQVVKDLQEQIDNAMEDAKVLFPDK